MILASFTYDGGHFLLQRTGGNELNICLEERVLYRLLSGMYVSRVYLREYISEIISPRSRSTYDLGEAYLRRRALFPRRHAATNTHVARFYHAPSKRKNRTVYEPNLECVGEA
jgi:hypothetical protein